MVSSFYFARVNMPRFDEYERADRPQFRFVTAADGEYIFADAHHAPVCRANIVGPTSGRVRANSNRPTQQFGFGMQIGRASCRERVCQYVMNWGVAVSLK